MSILGTGDLSPRRRRRHAGRYLGILLGLVVVAAAAFFGVKHFTGGSSSPDTSTLPLCKKTAPPGPAKPSIVHVRVLNGTLTGGLAAEVAVDLKHRGFHIESVGNTDKLVKTGTAIVSYGPGRLLEAQAVADEFAGATLQAGDFAGVQVAIGPSYTALASKSAAAQARAQYVQVDSSASPSPTPTATPTCRPRPNVTSTAKSTATSTK